MNLDPLTFSLSQINRLVAKLNKENYKQTTQNLLQLVSLYGLEAERQLLRSLVGQARCDEERPASVSVHVSFLAEHLVSLLNHPAKATALCQIVEPGVRSKASKPSTRQIERLIKSLKLSTAENVALTLALRCNPSTTELVSEQQLKKRLLDLVQCYLGPVRGHHVDTAGLQECSPEVLQTLLISLAHDNFQIPSVTKDLFLKRLREDFPREVAPIVLAPLLYPDDTQFPLDEVNTAGDLTAAMMEVSLADAIKDIGFSFTASVEECKKHITNFGVTEPKAVDVVKMMSSMMAKVSQDGPKLLTPGNFWLNHDQPKEGNTDGWNPEIFVQTIKDLANLNWKEVIIQLDQPEFLVPDRQALNLLFTILRLGLQGEGYQNFPVEYLCRRWQNSEGQLSLISNILKHPDIFSFADHPLHPVSIDILKTAPETDNKEVATWRGLYLIELLLYLSERGYYVQVHELFKFPLQHCPDILLLALLQINTATVLRQELLTALVPIFLGNHPNSATLLQHAWHTQNPNLKPLIMHAMADWYIRGDCDQTKLTRILDIAQDLKALSLLLNVQSFPFVIDLACLASRREYLKLDKWLTDKIRDHGEAFVSAMVKFLQRRCPTMGPDDLPKAVQLPPETITTLLACLQLCISNVQQDLQEAIYNVVANQTLVLNKMRQMMPGVRPNRSEFPGLFHMDPSASLTPGLNNMSLGFMNGSPRMNTGPNSPFGMMPHLAMGVDRMAPLPDTPRIPDPIPLPDMTHNMSKDIEEEANGYFQKIYNHPPYPSLSIEEVLEMLKKFQDSPSKREREVFSCMLRNLFEEYKFFPQYPDKELHITAQLFGGIIERGLVPSYVSLGLALRFVLDALRKPEGSKMYFFGVVALDKFKSRLKDYHMYCEHVRALPHFKQFPAHLIEYVEYGLQSLEPPTKPQGPVLPATLTSVMTQNSAVTTSAPYRAPTTTTDVTKIVTCGPGGRPSIANATNIDTLLTANDKQEKIIAPPEAIQDKTFFIFNNLSQLNLQTKCEELREFITEEYYPWLSQYLVMKRASIEFNFHALYSNFLDVLKVRAVNNMVAAETYRNIKVLLRTEKGIENFSDRSLLKNLGHWLGVITLGRNQPILHIDLDLKALLLEAYHKGQQELLYVVPFVAKVLESCAKSCFKPPNPWTMALISVLVELHQEPDLKLNLKFEVEVLCKNLSLDITELKPTMFLKNPENLKTIECQLSLEKQTKVQQVMMPPPPMIPTDTGVTIPIPAALIPTENISDILGIPEPRFSYQEVNFTSNAFEQKITYNPHIALLQTYPHLKQFVKPSIERSIQEWIHPVVDRSIKQALTTCEQIIRKDFAFEPNEVRMRIAAHHMMRNLTAAMAMITCRGQIVSTISTNLKAAFVTALLPTTQHQKDMIENASAVLATDNMELACAFIQKTAVEKALPEIDKRLMKDYEMRKLARQDGRCYYNELYEQRIPTRVQPRVGGPTDVQISVYEEFARNIPGFLPVRDPGVFVPKTGPQEQMPVTYGQPVDPAQVYIDELSALTRCAEALSRVDSGGPLAANARALAESAARARRARDGGSARALLRRAVEGFLDSQPAPPGNVEQAELVTRYRDIHLRVLRLLGDARVYGRAWAGKHVACAALECRDELRYNAEAADCLRAQRLLDMPQTRDCMRHVACAALECRDELRYNAEAADCLRAQRLLDMPQYDLSLAQLMDDGKNYAAVTFAMQLVQLYLNSNVQPGEAFHHTIETLIRVMSSRSAPEGLASLVEAIRVNQDPRCDVDPTVYIHQGIMQVRAREYNDPQDLQEKTENLLREWRSFLQSPLTEIEIAQNFHLYVHRMDMNGILNSDDTMTRFLRIGTQLCVRHVYRLLEEDRTRAPRTVRRERYYTACDSLVKLAALLVKHTDGGHAAPKLNLLNKVLGIIAGCLLQDHEDCGKGFQQLPYHRLLLILFLDMVMVEPVLESMNYQVVTAFCQALRTVRPSVAPGFCYSWLELVSHRTFIDRVLAGMPQRKGWDMYATLLMDLFEFLEPFLSLAELPAAVATLYAGLVRVLAVLLHDFPQFLWQFCERLARGRGPPRLLLQRDAADKLNAASARP
ncbi:CCR4-NOT transcription complex subunit 1-like [Epargyreus clarus]|uniref:CCR4-NOT transcription complex subunit 1-like n=1 Tax=Epargyreus clarus TaxID=520877 RepID=UPI003C30729C